MLYRQIKIIFLIIIFLTGIVFSGFSQSEFPDLKTLQEGVVDFSKEIVKSLPLNSSLGLNWADAYIGKLIPSAPPHFGIGGSFGFTTIELPVVKTLAGYFGYKLPFNKKKLLLPAYTAEARLGGLFLPFDIGFKIGYLPSIALWGSGMNINYLLVGGDIRYALLDKKVLPKISLGIGFNYLKSGIGGKAGSSQTFEFDGDSIILSQPDINLKWKTMSLDFKAQISKSLLIITPYIGIGATYAWSSAGYSVDTQITGDIDEVKGYIDSLRLKSINIDESGMSSIVKSKAFSFRTFGGLSFNMAVIKLDFTGLYSFRDKNFGASVGLRLQL